MASAILSTHCGNSAGIKGFDFKSCVGLRPTLSGSRTGSVRTARLPRRRLVVRASESGNRAANKLGMTVAECEAVVAAENVSEAALAPPCTPVIRPLLLSRRPRRNRKSPALRASFQETNLSPANLAYPLFIHEGEEDIPIGAMPGCFRLGWRHGLVEEVAKARDVGVNTILLFPQVPNSLKSPTAAEAFNDNGLVPRTIRLLKDEFPDLVVCTDVNLDAYSSERRDGKIREDDIRKNDEMVHQLCKQAVSQARAGADIVSPSEMMDGRIGAIRAALDAEGFPHVSIMSYTAKYVSAMFGPFHDAQDSNVDVREKKTSQLNPANYREALVQARQDEAEGADILMVKPGLPYLDIIRLLKDKSLLPIAAYQVSGEYSMIKAAGVLKMIDEEKVMMESLMCLRRAGSDVILTYFAVQAARRLCGEN